MEIITVTIAYVEVFDKEAQLLKQNYELKEQEWFEKHGDMEYATEINEIQKELDKL